MGTSTNHEQVGPMLNTPSLLGVFDTLPYFHDGSETSLGDTITGPGGDGEYDVRGLMNEAEIEDLGAFLLSLPKKY